MHQPGAAAVRPIGYTGAMNFRQCEGFKMKTVFIGLILSMIGSAMSGQAFAHVTGMSPHPVDHEFDEPHEIVRIYLKAVKRGELVVFEQTLDVSMLIPVRVEYVYELTNTVPRVKIYSELKPSIPVPGQTDCQVHGVSAVLDDAGNIVEVEIHVWAGES